MGEWGAGEEVLGFGGIDIISDCREVQIQKKSRPMLSR